MPFHASLSDCADMNCYNAHMGEWDRLLSFIEWSGSHVYMQRHVLIQFVAGSVKMYSGFICTPKSLQIKKIEVEQNSISFHSNEDG